MVAGCVICGSPRMPKPRAGAKVGEYANVGAGANVGVGAKVGEYANVGAGANVGEYGTNLLCFFAKGRSGNYPVTLFMDKNGPAFNWGCRSGRSLADYIDAASPAYPREDADYLKTIWFAFVQRNT